MIYCVLWLTTKQLDPEFLLVDCHRFINRLNVTDIGKSHGTDTLSVRYHKDS